MLPPLFLDPQSKLLLAPEEHVPSASTLLDPDEEEKTW
jgi:hypothetical protein